MNAWREVTLAEVSERVDYGYTASATYDPDLPRFLRVTDIARSHLDWSSAPGCVIDDAKFDKFSLNADDIVVARSGTIGHAKRLRSSPKSVFASYLVRFRLSPEVDPAYVGAVVESNLYRNWVIQHAGGAAQPNANAKVLGAFPFLLPSRQEQESIGRLFDAFHELIENNRRRTRLLSQMAQAIYREWFVDFRYPGHETATFVDSAFGPTPEDWEIKPFAELASFINGFAFKPAHWGERGRPIIKIKELKHGITADTPRCDEQEISERFWVKTGDLLFSWSADLGVYRWSDEPGLLNQHLFNVTPSGRLSLPFLLRALDQAMPQFRNLAQGTTMRHIKRSALSEITAAVPPQEVIDLFTAAVEPCDQQLFVLRQCSNRLDAIRELLLPKLVTGEIDVSGLDLDAVAGSVA